MSLNASRLQQAFDERGLGPFFTPASLQSLTLFTQKMLQINETLNLTRWVEDEAVLNFHLLDSALALPALKPLMGTGKGRWVDLGTGCGFPGSVLMVAFPQAEVTLFDSVTKKVKALEECMATAGLTGQTLVGRAEEMGRDPRYREQYDGVVARAVADLPVLLEYAMPLLKTGGYLVDWMTADQVSRLKASEKALQTLQAKVIQTVDYLLPGSDQKRSYVVIQKKGATPTAYPRVVGQPSKNPL